MTKFPPLIIISSPSGAGKSTLCKMLIERNKNIKLSISATTRKPRKSEIDGKHYFFISQEKFSQMIKNNDFLEYATVFGNSYGTPRKMIEEEINKGNSMLFDIDWQGARQIFRRFDDSKICSFFILPPSIKELHKRLQKRAEDSEETVLERMKKAKDEMSHFNEYHHVIINKNLEDSYQKIINLLQPNNKNQIKENLSDFINKLIVEEL